MAACKDCLHAEVCLARREVTKPCYFYKERELYVKLPCKQGNLVFEPYKGQITIYEVTEFSIVGEKVFAMLSRLSGISLLPCIRCSAFGETVFLTREEAENKLKEDSDEQ